MFLAKHIESLHFTFTNLADVFIQWTFGQFSHKRKTFTCVELYELTNIHMSSALPSMNQTAQKSDSDFRASFRDEGLSR